MVQVLHSCARTTQAVRWAIQGSQESLSQLAKRYGINPKTVAKWKKRTSLKDAPMGPKQVHSTVLTPQQEAACVAFRKTTLLSLDDCLYALQETIPHLTRSSLHRCFQRHHVRRLPKEEGAQPTKKKFARYPIGYFHMDIAEVRMEEGKLYLFVAIDRTSKFVYAELLKRYSKVESVQFLHNLISVVPYHIRTILTDNGIQFANRQKDRWAFPHIFDRICFEQGIEHRLTQVHHPWTNGQVERMNRTLKEATIKRYHYDNHDQLKEHLYHFLNAYNFAKRLKALRGLTPYENIIKCWQNEPERFKIDPDHHTLGLNT